MLTCPVFSLWKRKQESLHRSKLITGRCFQNHTCYLKRIHLIIYNSECRTVCGSSLFIGTRNTMFSWQPSFGLWIISHFFEFLSFLSFCHVFLVFQPWLSFIWSEIKIYSVASVPLMDFLVKHKWMYNSARRFFITVQSYNRLKAVSFY